MKYLRLFEYFDSHDPYELMIIPPNKKAEMIMDEIKKSEPNLNLIKDLITLGANLDWKDGYDYTALHTAARYGQVEIVRMLIDAGSDVNLQNDRGCTPLHLAAFIHMGKTDIARMLIDAGARKDIQDKEGRIPYDLAGTKELKIMLQP
jgi:ankyrin repeat protein